MAAVPLIFEQQMIGRLVSQWASTENRWGCVGGICKICIKAQSQGSFLQIHRASRQLFEASVSASLSQRLEKLFPHVVCRRRGGRWSTAYSTRAQTPKGARGRMKKWVESMKKGGASSPRIQLVIWVACVLAGRKNRMESWDSIGATEMRSKGMSPSEY